MPRVIPPAPRPIKTDIAALCADPNNLQKIRDAFPEYWKQYTDMAEGR